MPKLTLIIDREVLKRAEEFARNSEQSLSEIVENYLQIISSSKKNKSEEDLDFLRGIMQLDSSYDEKKEIRKILSDKQDQ